MTRRKSHRTLTVVPVFPTGPDVPTIEEVRAQALPVLTRLFVSAIRNGREKQTLERA